MSKRKKKIIRWIVFLLLAYFVTRPMYYLGIGDNIPRINISVSDILTPEETDNFLISWSDFLEKGFDNQEIISRLNSNKNINDVVSSRAERWIALQGWNVNRFFFVGKRMFAIVKECREIQKKQSKRDSLEQQMKNTKDESIIGTIKKIIDKDAKLSGSITQSEINMIMPNIDKIESILYGKVAYKPQNAN